MAREKQMSVAETKKHFTEVLRKLKDPVTVTRHGEPVAVILSSESYLRLCRQSAFKGIIELRKDFSKSKITAEEAYRLSRKELAERTDPDRR